MIWPLNTSSTVPVFILSVVYDTASTVTHFLFLVLPRSFLSQPVHLLFLLPVFLHICLLLIQDSMQILPPHQMSSLITLGALSGTCYHMTLFYVFLLSSSVPEISFFFFLFYVFIAFFSPPLPTKI